MSKEDKRFLTVSQFCKEFNPWPTEAGLRTIIFYSHENGFNTAFRRVGRRVLVEVDTFWEIVNKSSA